MSTAPDVVDTLFTGGDIITVDPEAPYIRAGAVAVRANKIVAIGSETAVHDRIKGANRTIDFSGQVMIPGLVDAHTHLFQSLGKTLGDGLSLLPWLERFMLPLASQVTREQAVIAVRFAALLSALSGTTTVVDQHYAPVDEDSILAVADAYQEAGIRATLARGMFGPITEGGHRMNCDPRMFNYTVQQELDITRACMHAMAGNRLVDIWPGPKNVVYADPDLLIGSSELARDFDLSWQVHCSESKFEVEIFESLYGMRPAAWLYKQNILGDHTTLAHGIWLDDEEIRMLGESATTVIHNPISNQYLASGIVRLEDLLKAGANVTLGTDGTAIAGQHMFEAMKTGLMLQRVGRLDPEVTTAEMLLTMATRLGGKMLHKNLGMLREGALADLTIVDTRALHHQPCLRPVASLIFFTRGADVRYVMVDGDLIVENGRSTKLNQEELIADMNQASRAVVEKAGIAELLAPWQHPRLIS